MLDNFRISAKKISKSALKQNFSKVFVISIIAYIPSSLFALVVTSFALLSPVFTVAGVDVNVDLSLLIANLSYVLLGFLFYPLSISATKIFLKIIAKEPYKLMEMFEYYKDFPSFVSTFKLYIWVIFKTFIAILPYLLVMVAMGITYILIPFINDFVDILIATFYGMIFAVLSIFMLSKIVLIELYEKICMLNIDDTSFKKGFYFKKFANKFKGKTMNLIVLSLSFIGWSLLAGWLTNLTMGISTCLFSAYYTMSITLYAKAHFDGINNLRLRGVYDGE